MTIVSLNNYPLTVTLLSPQSHIESSGGDDGLDALAGDSAGEVGGSGGCGDCRVDVGGPGVSTGRRVSQMGDLGGAT